MAALYAALVSLSSCMNSNLPIIEIMPENDQANNSENYVKLGTITKSSTYKYTVKVSTNAEIYIDNIRVAVASNYDKGDKSKNSIIKIKAIATTADYSNVPVEKFVKLDTNGKEIYIDIPKLASKTTTTTAASAKSAASSNGSIKISNSTTNQSFAYNAKTTASLTLTSAALSSVADDKVLGFDIENAASGDIKQENQTQTEEFFNVMTVKATALGTKLGEASKLEINNSNFESGMVFKSSSDSKDIVIDEASNISFNINEMKDYTISCQARILLLDSMEATPVQGFFDVPVGNKSITYNTKSGYICDYTTNEFINKYLTAKFGSYTEQGKQTITIVNNSERANVPYKITQKIYLYQVSFGSITVKVNVYGPDNIEIDSDKAERYTYAK